VIQLDNTTKGKEMLGQPNGQPLSEPQMQELNGHVEKLPIIEQLQENDKQLLEGQQDIEDRLDKGAKRMDGIEDELKRLGDALKDGLKEVIAEVKDQKFSELKDELTNRKTSGKELQNFFIKTAVLTVIAVLGYLFVKSYG